MYILRPFNHKNTWIYLLLAISLVLLFFEIINNRFYMHDLEVYYKTATRIVQGQELYRIHTDGHYVFKYSPTSAIYFIPFILVPYTAAKVVFWCLLTGLVGVILSAFYNLVNFAEKKYQGEQQKNIILVLSLLAVGTHLHREWHLGQVNLLLLVLYVLMLLSLVNKHYKTASFLLAFSLFIKPFGLIFIPFLLLKQKYQTLIYTIVFLVGLGLLPLIFYPNIATFEQLYVSWFQELIIELRAKQSLLNDGNHTIFSVLVRYTPLQQLLGNAQSIKIYQIILLLVLGFLLLYYIRLGRHLKHPMVAEGAVLISLIPLLAFTSMNAFLFTLPCIIFLLFHLTRLPILGKVVVAVACILIGGNIRDLVGAKTFGLLEDISVYTFGTLILLGMMFYFRLKLIR